MSFPVSHDVISGTCVAITDHFHVPILDSHFSSLKPLIPEKHNVPWEETWRLGTVEGMQSAGNREDAKGKYASNSNQLVEATGSVVLRRILQSLPAWGNMYM